MVRFVLAAVMVLASCREPIQEAPVREAFVRRWPALTFTSLAAGPAGTFYAAGGYEGRVTFSTRSGLEEHVASGRQDAFLARFDERFETEWVRTFGGPQQDEIAALTVTAAGAPVVGGFFGGQVDFDPGDGRFEARKIGSSAAAFVSRFDAAGELVAVTAWSTDVEPDASYVEGLVAQEDRVMAIGRFRGGLPYAGGLQSIGGSDAFIAKVAPDGTVEATITVASAQDDIAVAAPDASGRIWIAAKHGPMPAVDGVVQPIEAGLSLWHLGGGDPARRTIRLGNDAGRVGAALVPRALAFPPGAAAAVVVGGTNGPVDFGDGAGVVEAPGGFILTIPLEDHTPAVVSWLPAVAPAERPAHPLRLEAVVPGSSHAAVFGAGLTGLAGGWLGAWNVETGVVAPALATSKRRARSALRRGSAVLCAGDELGSGFLALITGL